MRSGGYRVVEDGEPMPREVFMHDQAFRFLALIREGKDSCGWREDGIRRGITALYVALLFILLIPRSASAQATATLNGVVRDPSGAVLPQATVTLQNTDTSTLRESLTND